MRKARDDERDPDMLGEYDFSKMVGVRGKYAERFSAGSNVVVLEPDVAEVFPTSEAVNEALRTLTRIVRARIGKPPVKT